MQLTTLKNALTQYLEKSGKDCSADVFEFTVPPDRKFGDICINIFPAVKATKIPPPQLAEEVLTFMKNESYVTDGNIQGGFVNLRVADELFQKELSAWSLPTFPKKEEKIIIDYMGPNIGKPLHIGHLCTPLFGQATINLLRTMGYEVIADMHQGDWGGIFGKLITGWKYFGDEEAFEKNPVHHLLEIYVSITEKIENENTKAPLKPPISPKGGLTPSPSEGVGERPHGELEQECRDAFKKLSEGDETSVNLWQRFTDKSLAGVREVMSEFGVHPDIWIGESFYEGLPLPKLGNWPDLTSDNTMSAVVDELVAKGIATKNDDESVGIIFDEKERKEKNLSTFYFLPSTKGNLPSCILQKRDGTHGYLASDLAAIKYRLKNWSPARIIYFVDNRQELHFRQLFATAKTAWIGEKNPQLNIEHGTLNIELTHASNGFVSLPDGAMSTRHGRVIFLEDLIGESFDRVKKILLERERKISDNDTKSVALGAIIYSFLSQDRERDWIFEWDKVLAFEGNSGPYLQYTYVRWKKVLDEISEKGKVKSEKVGIDPAISTLHFSLSTLSVYDRDLILDILGFNELLLACGTTYKFHLLVAHLATMARHLNALYANTPKLKETSSTERAARVEIIQRALEIIRYTSNILGMPLPEEM